MKKKIAILSIVVMFFAVNVISAKANDEKKAQVKTEVKTEKKADAKCCSDKTDKTDKACCKDKKADAKKSCSGKCSDHSEKKVEKK